MKSPAFTVFGRSLLLIALEVAANVICWAIAARSHAILGLAILAWTIGLRHALDADHIRSLDLNGFCHRALRLISIDPPRVIHPRQQQLISVGLSAIDNATRTLINHGRLAITCGLFFSLGHSTIVIVVNVAIVISTKIYTKLAGAGSDGSIVGTAISGSFLFIVGIANSIILWKILRRRRQARRKRGSEHGETETDPTPNENMLMMRLLGPLVNFVNRPWKMYPVGVLFGLGFDTASSIALLAISALAKGGMNNTRISPSEVIILPLLFTTGMTLVDSLDSILMFYSYTGFAGHSWRILEPNNPPSRTDGARSANVQQSRGAIEAESRTVDAGHDSNSDAGRQGHDRMVLVKRSTMSQLSITLTAMSILLAFSISLIEIMGLIGANCGKCRAAASASDGGGLAGAWWRFWTEANNDYGYIGAAIVGMFVVVVGGWYIVKRFYMFFTV